MRLLIASAVLASCGTGVVPRGVNAQEQWIALIPLVRSDTVDQRLATALRDALAVKAPQIKVTAKRDIEWMLMHTDGSDTLSRQDLREFGKLMRADVVIGVHRCAEADTCVWMSVERLVWPSSPDTMQFRGPAWIQAATDTLALRYLQKPTGR